jgi:hypothetical protein
MGLYLWRGLLMAWDLSSYELVEDRIKSFWAEHLEDGRIETELVSHNEGHYIVKAKIWVGDRCVATGLADENVKTAGAFAKNCLELAETSAIGRALANFTFSKKGAPRPSREEMQKALSDTEPELVKPTVFTSGPASRAGATDKQIGFAKSMLKDVASTLEFDKDEVTKWACEKYSVAKIEDFSRNQISHLIADLQNSKVGKSEFYDFVRAKKGPDYDPWATPSN